MISKIYRINTTAISDRKGPDSLPDVWIRAISMKQEEAGRLIIEFGVMMENSPAWTARDANSYERRKVLVQLQDRPEQTIIIAGLKIYEATRKIHIADRARITARIMHLIAPQVHAMPHDCAKPPSGLLAFRDAKSWTRRALGL